jgi:signal peptide peptidase SppA
VLILLFLALCLGTGLTSLVTGPHRPEKDPIEEEYELFGPTDLLAGLRPEGVALLRVDGGISFKEPSSFGSDQGADRIISHLKKIAKSSAVKAVVLRVNSPGGTVAASQEIADAVRGVRRAGKKVVVSMADMAASGGYYISAPSDYIFANAGTITGSIGVITQLPRYKGIAEKVGYGVVSITSGKFKDMGNPFRDLRKDERDLFERTIMGAYLQFLEEVASGRAAPLLAHLDAQQEFDGWREQLEMIRAGEDHSRSPLSQAPLTLTSAPAHSLASTLATTSTSATALTTATKVDDMPAPRKVVPLPELDMGKVRQRVAELADGRIYTGSEALRIGLVDEIGGLREAIRKAGELAGLGPNPVILKPRSGADLGSFLKLMGRSPGTALESLRSQIQGFLGIPPAVTLPRHLPVAYLYTPGS